MRQILGVCALPLLAMIATPVAAQDHAANGSHAENKDDPDTHEEMDQGAMDHAAIARSMSHSPAPAGADDPADQPGNAAPPPVPTDHAADAVFPADVMARSRGQLYAGMRLAGFNAVMDRLEYRLRNGVDGYAVKGQAWYGGDIDRAVVGVEGEGSFGKTPETMELDAYWHHAIDPWFNLQLGARHDLRPGPHRSYAMIGIEGLAPYWIETQLRAFVSEKGDVHLRAEAAYDQRITQRLALEPEAELDFALQDVPELGIGGGFDRLELSARLRYEIARNFSPYLGVSWERRFGRSAAFALADGEDPSTASWLVGIRFWF